MPIDTRQMEVAAEFCRVAGKSDLYEYLGLNPTCTAEEAQEALKRKRKYMQGMQSNPKYKTEAVQFIKNYATFQSMLADPASYTRDIANVQERKNLPVLEMSIKSALKGGDLSNEQVDYLRRNAGQLGIGEDTFIGTLNKLITETGTKLPGGSRQPSLPPPPSNIPHRTVTPTSGAKTLERDPLPASAARTLDNEPPDDPYAVLGARRDMPLAEIRELYHDRLRRARTLPRGQGEAVVARLEAAWSRVAEQSTPADLSRRSTGPPARDRETGSPDTAGQSPLAAPTAPPVRQRTTQPLRRGTEEFTPVAEPSAPIGRRNTLPAPIPDHVAMRSVPSIPGPAAADNAGDIEIRGAATRQVRVLDSAITLPLFLLVHVRPPPSARVTSSASWLTAQPLRLEAGHEDHQLTVRIDPQGLPRDGASATITVTTESGAAAEVTFEVERGREQSRALYVIFGLLALLVALALVYLIATLALA